jgi:hypothetical protein
MSDKGLCRDVQVAPTVALFEPLFACGVSNKPSDGTGVSASRLVAAGRASHFLGTGALELLGVILESALRHNKQ